MFTWLLFLVHLLLLGGAIWLIYKKSRMLPLQRFFFPAILIKLSAGVLLGLLYQWHFKGGDTFNYFHDAAILSTQATEDFSAYFGALGANTLAEGLPAGLYFTHQPRALFFSKLVSFFTLITYQNYWLTALYLSLLSFLGIWYLANQLVKYYPKTRIAAAIAFLFFPSFVFWGSGVMKESIALPAICILVGLTLCSLKKSQISVKEIVLIILVSGIIFWLLWQLKYYYFGVLTPVLGTTLLATFISKKAKVHSIYLRASMWLIIFAALLGMASFVHPNLQFGNFARALVQNHDLIFNASAPENVIHFEALAPTWKSLLKNSPEALVSGLFRPFIWETHTFLQFLFALENTLLCLLTFMAIFQIGQLKINGNDKMLLLAVVIYIVLLATLLALASPNFGSLARYRVGFLPFLVYIVLVPLNKWRADFQSAQCPD